MTKRVEDKAGLACMRSQGRLHTGNSGRKQGKRKRRGGGKEDGPRTPAFSSVQHYVSRMSKTGWKAV